MSDIVRLSVIIPMLNEAASIQRTLAALDSTVNATSPASQRHSIELEVIVVDGGSTDGSAALATPLCDQLIHAAPGRATQMNAGAAASSGELLLFLHADTLLPANALAVLAAATATAEATAPGRSRSAWGRFDVRIDGTHPMLRVVAASMNLRSRLTGIATGDQAIFISRAAFVAVGGFPAQPLMEDIEMSRRLNRISRPLCLRAAVTTSGRRWEKAGVWRTILLMWSLRLRYWLGTSPDQLARRYR